MGEECVWEWVEREKGWFIGGARDNPFFFYQQSRIEALGVEYEPCHKQKITLLGELYPGLLPRNQSNSVAKLISKRIVKLEDYYNLECLLGQTISCTKDYVPSRFASIHQCYRAHSALFTN